MINNWQIQQAFRTQLQTYGALPAVAWENKSFSPTEGTPWLQEHLMAGNETPSATNEVSQTGIMQYSLFYSSGSGVKDIKQTADNIKHLFKPGTILSGLVQCNSASVQRGANSGSWYSQIIKIAYTVYASND